MTRKIINARISPDLYVKIADKAKKKRITVSNLIRNIVEDSLDISDDVLDLVDEKIRRYIHTEENEVIGYQSLTLAKQTSCGFCGKELNKGDHVHVAFSENLAASAVICDTCKHKQEKQTEQHEHASGKE